MAADQASNARRRLEFQKSYSLEVNNITTTTTIYYYYYYYYYYIIIAVVVVVVVLVAAAVAVAVAVYSSFRTRNVIFSVVFISIINAINYPIRTFGYFSVFMLDTF